MLITNLLMHHNMCQGIRLDSNMILSGHVSKVCWLADVWIQSHHYDTMQAWTKPFADVVVTAPAKHHDMPQAYGWNSNNLISTRPPALTHRPPLGHPHYVTDLQSHYTNPHMATLTMSTDFHGPLYRPPLDHPHYVHRPPWSIIQTPTWPPSLYP